MRLGKFVRETQDWQAMGPDDAPEAWAGLRAWVEGLVERYPHIDQGAVPLCWYRHPGHVEALRALRDCEETMSLYNFLVAVSHIEGLLRRWTGLAGCVYSHCEPASSYLGSTDEKDWVDHIVVDQAQRAVTVPMPSPASSLEGKPAPGSPWGELTGWTMAHEAARLGQLPNDFDLWGLADRKGTTVAHVAAQYGCLPESFARWDMADCVGTTVAHVAAQCGHLPNGFDNWDMVDGDQTTVAHIAAQYSNLPKGFACWDMVDRRGVTVAHVAAQYGNLPKGFTFWDLADFDGTTVAHVVAQYGCLPKDFIFWDLADQNHTTVAHVAARYGNLPNDFARWDMIDCTGTTVAQVAAENGHLPPAQAWRLKDDDEVFGPCAISCTSRTSTGYEHEPTQEAGRHTRRRAMGPHVP